MELLIRFYTSFLKLPYRSLKKPYVKPKKPRIKHANKISDPRLLAIWVDLANRFFSAQSDLLNYKICWSNRKQKRVLGSCSIERQTVTIASAMNSERAEPHLEALLYHEMCHAVVGIKRSASGRRIIHGKAFHELESRHPGIKLLDIWIKNGGWSSAVRSYAQRARYLS